MITDAFADESDWRQLANCRDMDDAIFYDTYSRDGVALAKKICRRCPVTTQCLTWAVEHREPYGIWGGLTERERRGQAPSRRGRGAKPREIRHGTEGGYYTHRRRGEDPCTECRHAATAAHRRRDERRAERLLEFGASA